MQIIITVDDLGMHPAVRRAAQHLAARGRATSVSLMANGPDVENCLEGGALGAVGVGVQLNVLQGKPLISQDKVSTLIRSDGNFLGKEAELFQRFLQGKVMLTQIEEEWAAQIEFLQQRGVRLTHLTCHGSMHGWPGLMHLAGRLAEHYRIGWIRRPRPCEEVLSPGQGRSHSEFMNVCTMLRQLPEPIRMPDLVWGRDQESGDGQAMSFLRDMRGMAGEAGHEVVEIVGRPGLSEKGDPPLPAGFEQGPTRAQWETALAAMDAQQWRIVREQQDAQVVDYGSIAEDGIGSEA